jgi:hypothetical protein
MNSKSAAATSGKNLKIPVAPPGKPAELKPDSEETCLESLAAHDLRRDSGHTRKTERHPTVAHRRERQAGQA